MMSKQTHELIANPDMYLFIERTKRKGMSFIGYRYAEANNKYLENYNPTKESSQIMYFDANSLYSWAMCKPLPGEQFKWVKSKNNNRFMEKSFIKENLFSL